MIVSSKCIIGFSSADFMCDATTNPGGKIVTFECLQRCIVITAITGYNNVKSENLVASYQAFCSAYSCDNVITSQICPIVVKGGQCDIGQMSSANGKLYGPDCADIPGKPAGVINTADCQKQCYVAVIGGALVDLNPIEAVTSILNICSQLTCIGLPKLPALPAIPTLPGTPAGAPSGPTGIIATLLATVQGLLGSLLAGLRDLPVARTMTYQGLLEWYYDPQNVLEHQ
jgi:hypothetical protein